MKAGGDGKSAKRIPMLFGVSINKSGRYNAERVRFLLGRSHSRVKQKKNSSTE